MELNANLAVLFLVVVVCVLYCVVCGDSIKYQNEYFFFNEIYLKKKNQIDIFFLLIVP